MATAFIQYNNYKGFNIAESYMQLMIYYIYEEFKAPQYFFANKNLFLMDFESIIAGAQCGYLVLTWKRIIANSAEEQTMIQILQNVKDKLQSKGNSISVTELQSIPTEDEDFKRLYSRNPFPTAELIKIIDALIKMLQNTWDSTDYDMEINYQY